MQSFQIVPKIHRNITNQMFLIYNKFVVIWVFINTFTDFCMIRPSSDVDNIRFFRQELGHELQILLQSLDPCLRWHLSLERIMVVYRDQPNLCFLPSHDTPLIDLILSYELYLPHTIYLTT